MTKRAGHQNARERLWRVTARMFQVSWAARGLRKARAGSAVR